jgi:hypothetical protein
MRAAFRDPGLPAGASLVSLQCKGDSCQVEMTATDIASYKKSIERMFLDPATSMKLDMSVYFPSQEEHPDGTYKSTFYLVPGDYVPPVL